MHCIDNMERITLSTDIVMKMMNLYEFKGKEFYYHDVLESDLEYIQKQNIERETFFAYKILGLDISENRVRLIIKKNSKTKSKDEILLSNIKRMFVLIHSNIKNFELTANSFLDLAKFIYNEVEDVRFASYQKLEQNTLLRERKTVYKRDDLRDLLHAYTRKMDSNEYEKTLLITNFFVDFLNTKCFKITDDRFLAYVALYIMLFKEGFELFKYISFFEILYNNQAQFNNAILHANFNWENGYSQTGPLHMLLVSEILKSYQIVEKLIRDYQYDNKLNKSDNIENTIIKAGDTFTKDEIRAKHPYVSESTINRTLQRLRDEGKIRPLSTGRSAKWLRVIPVTKKILPFEQLNIFGEEE